MPREFEYFDKKKRPKLEYPEINPDYIDYEVKQVVKRTGDGEDDFEIHEEIIEHKVNTDKFINSYKDTVGIKAVIDMVTKTKDISLLNEKEAEFADLSEIPELPQDKLRLARSTKEAFEKIDSNLRGEETVESFIKNLSQEKLDAYISAKVAEKLKEQNGGKE